MLEIKILTRVVGDGVEESPTLRIADSRLQELVAFPDA